MFESCLREASELGRGPRSSGNGEMKRGEVGEMDLRLSEFELLHLDR